jgi:hypothetical protein
MTENVILIKSFDITEDLIKMNPNDENKIINEFNNFIIKVKSSCNNKSFVRSATYSDTDNPIDINIQNNFQRYNRNANPNEYNNTNNTNNTNDTNRIGINNDKLITNTRIETFSNKNDNLFKEYFSFK